MPEPAPDIPILVFARAPEPGRTKRRLTPVLGDEGAANLHERMIRTTVAVAGSAAIGPVQLWCTPSTDHIVFRCLKTEFAVSLHRQSGADLGQRMLSAFEYTLASYPGAVLVGTDCPSLRAADMAEAAGQLRKGTGAVFVPAIDGGYVLVGLSRPAPELFADVPWGTGGVMAATRDRLRKLGWKWRELAARRDIDRPEDLVELGF